MALFLILSLMHFCFKIQWRFGGGSEECKQHWCPLYFIGRYIQEHLLNPPEMHIFFVGVDTEGSNYYNGIMCGLCLFI